MAVLSDAIRAALESDPSQWPGALDDAGRSRFEGALGALPLDVREALLSGLVDPQRRVWASGALMALVRLGEGGAQVVGMAHDDVVEMADPQGVRYGVAAIALGPRQSPQAAQLAEALLSALDGIFADRGYVVHLNRALPEDLDVASVTRAVRLWLSELGHGDHEGLRASYQEGTVRIDFILTAGDRKGRQLTLGPVDALERLHAIECELIEAVAKHEQALGDLPLVVVLTSDDPWRMPRGYVQLQLYGTTRSVVASSGRQAAYEAWFPARGSAMFHDPMFQNMASLWWLAPAAPPRRDPFASDLRAYDNPWSRVRPEIDPLGPHFATVTVSDEGCAHLRWQR